MPRVAQPGGAEARPRSRLRARLAAVGIALAVGLLVGEVLVRVRHGAPLAERLPILRVRANPHRGWEMMPGEDHYTYLHPVRMNALGLRGPELPEEKRGELRVLALGDSLIYGQGVGDDETVPHHVEERLARMDAGERRFRVVNSGHRGYATNQELGLLRELGPRIRPDLAVLFWYWNDIVSPDVALIHERLSAQGPVTFDANAPLEGRVLLEWHLRQLARRSALLMHLHDVWHAWHSAPWSEEQFRLGLETLDAQLGELRALCAELGAAPLFVALPDPAAVDRPHPSRTLFEGALSLARAHGLPTLDLTPPLRELYAGLKRPPILPYDGHYDPRANRVIGESVGAWIEELFAAGELALMR